MGRHHKMEQDWSSNKTLGWCDDKVTEWIDDKVLVKDDNIDGFDDDGKSLVYMAKGWNGDKVELLCKAEIQFDNIQELDGDDHDKVVE